MSKLTAQPRMTKSVEHESFGSVTPKSTWRGEQICAGDGLLEEKTTSQLRAELKEREEGGDRLTATGVELIGTPREQAIPEGYQLVITFDIRTDDNSIYLKSPHLQSLSSALPQMGLVKPGDVALSIVPIAECDLDAAIKTPAEPLRVPISLELFHSDAPTKLVLRARVGLNHYDGVSCVYVALNVLEYLESGSVAQTSKLVRANPPPSDHPARCYLRMLRLVLYNAGRFSRDLLLWLGSRFRRRSFEPINGAFGSVLQDLKGEEVSYRRYSVPREMGFREYVQSLCEGLQNLGFKGFIYSINYNPKVAMSVTPHWDSLLRKEARTQNMFLPPFPVNPQNMFRLLFASHVLFNNYGRYKPRISGEVVDIDWHSPGMASNVTMALSMTIGARTWLIFRARRKCHELLLKSVDWLAPR